MIPDWFAVISEFTHWMSPLRAGLYDFWGAWLRYNTLEWNNHYSGHPAVTNYVL